MTDIETVKLLLGNTAVSDDLVSFYLDSTAEFIKAYCNIPEIVPALKPTYLEITAMRVKANSTSDGKASINDGAKQVASLSDGNQSISYASGTAGSKQFISEEDFVSSYGYLLDRFRRLVTDGAPCFRTQGSRCIHTQHPHPNRARW